ncbi:MAG: MotA/TolQ/ExbB proton channel family protein [Gammaproteobacteria bacterium]|nr:MotA/TolQ/ExbB proton channel family protein [Gammaproteobacteria bacterium]
MYMKNTFALFVCVLIFLFGFFLKGNLSLYFNLAGIMVVVGGSAAAALISYGVDRLIIVYRVTKASFKPEVTSEREIISILMDLSIRSRIKGILSLQEQEEELTTHFLRRALGCLVDGFKPNEMRDVLNTEMYFFKLRRDESERVLRTIGNFLPAFGIIGSVVGLISMLAGIGDTSVILAAVPVALTSTLYGIALANFLFIPFAENIRERTKHELLLQKIIMDGVIAIETEINPRLLEAKLQSFLTPSERSDELVSYHEIIKRFKLRHDEERAQAEAAEG